MISWYDFRHLFLIFFAVLAVTSAEQIEEASKFSHIIFLKEF